MRELLGVIVGEGGQPLESYWKIRNLRIAEWIMKGIERRKRPLMEISRTMTRGLASAWVKNLPEYYPYAEAFEWERHERDESDEGKAQEAERAAAVMDRMLRMAERRAAKDGGDTDTSAAIYGGCGDREAAMEGGGINTERDGES